ncbi:MAG: hypothetical protein EBR02_02795 [Alphaproteobacteria bacterium]|nr:hypothetical protein [Alphaproteobacteria bacterium]
MKSVYTSLLLIALSAVPVLATEQSEIMAGCEGEGCGCAREKVTDEAAVLYEKMDKASSQVATLPAGTATQPPEAYMKIISRGSAVLTAIHNPDAKLPVKVGDKIDTIMNEGEGFTSARFNDASFSFYFSDIELNVTEEPQYEQWYKIDTGSVSGYSNIFPYEGCLE